MGLSLPLVEFYALGLAAVWLSLVVSVALVVAGAPVVELVDVVAGGGSAGLGGNGIALTSIWPGSVPNGVGSPSGLKGGVLPSKGSVSPGLGGGVGPGVLPGVGSCSPICSIWPGSPVLSCPFCFSSSSWASLAWGLSWVLGSSPALPSWVSSRVAAP